VNFFLIKRQAGSVILYFYPILCQEGGCELFLIKKLAGS
jgi:hypothetical protein